MKHEFIEKLIIQQNYEIHRFLYFWRYKKKTDRLVIPTGLCAICDLLKVQHYE